jgi:hypothetical protein
MYDGEVILYVAVIAGNTKIKQNSIILPSRSMSFIS